jgi:biopolymer transport protein ExbB
MLKNKYFRFAKGFFIRFSVLVIVMVAISMIITDAKASARPSGDISPDGSKTFFTQFVIAGGPIVWFVLLPMSVVALYLAIDVCFMIRRKKLLPPGIAANIASRAGRLGAKKFSAGISSRADLVSRAFVCALSQGTGPGTDKNQLRRLAAESLNEQAMVLLRKIEWFSIVGNVAPMVGLFGTVFGMIKAFNLLGISGAQPRPDQLAAAISIALITTFWGLLIAIPALAMYGVFRTRIESLVSEAAIELETLFRRITFVPFARTEPVKKPPKIVQLRKYHAEPEGTKDAQEKITLPLNSIS